MADDLLFGDLRRERHFRLRDMTLEQFTEQELLSRYRFGRESIEVLTDLLREDLQRETARNHALQPSVQILVALRFFASGSFLQVVGDTVGLTKSTVSRIVSDVSRALARKQHQFILWPTAAEIQHIKEGFYEKGGFPGVIGCVDGSHVRIQAPNEHENDYVNRKGFHSINVQAVCNHKGMFTNIVARWPGCTHDSFVFNNSLLCERLHAQHHSLEDGLLLGDSGYACRPFLMTPFPNPVTVQQQDFNMAHKRTRVAIEQAFGWWKRRFHLLHGEIRMQPEKVCTLIGACAVLHNIAILRNEPLIDGIVVDPNEVEIVPYHGPENGRALRDHICNSFF